MADFPPPRYFEAYTDEAVSAGTAPKPPPLPTDGVVIAFGTPVQLDSTIIRPIEHFGVPRLYAKENVDHVTELRRINGEIVKTFLSILDAIGASDADKRNSLLEHLKTLFMNVHHLLNEFRPHQAVATVKAMLETQLKQREDLAKEIARNLEVTQDQIVEIHKLALAELDVQQGLSGVVDQKPGEPGDAGPAEGAQLPRSAHLGSAGFSLEELEAEIVCRALGGGSGEI